MESQSQEQEGAKRTNHDIHPVRPERDYRKTDSEQQTDGLTKEAVAGGKWPFTCLSERLCRRGNLFSCDAAKIAADHLDVLGLVIEPVLTTSILGIRQLALSANASRSARRGFAMHESDWPLRAKRSDGPLPNFGTRILKKVSLSGYGPKITTASGGSSTPCEPTSICDSLARRTVRGRSASTGTRCG